jgi:hypothetical protein
VFCQWNVRASKAGRRNWQSEVGVAAKSAACWGLSLLGVHLVPALLTLCVCLSHSLCSFWPNRFSLLRKKRWTSEQERERERVGKSKINKNRLSYYLIIIFIGHFLAWNFSLLKINAPRVRTCVFIFAGRWNTASTWRIWTFQPFELFECCVLWGPSTVFQVSLLHSISSSSQCERRDFPTQTRLLTWRLALFHDWFVLLCLYSMLGSFVDFCSHPRNREEGTTCLAINGHS